MLVLLAVLSSFLFEVSLGSTNITCFVSPTSFGDEADECGTNESVACPSINECISVVQDAISNETDARVFLKLKNGTYSGDENCAVNISIVSDGWTSITVEPTDPTAGPVTLDCSTNHTSFSSPLTGVVPIISVTGGVLTEAVSFAFNAASPLHIVATQGTAGDAGPGCLVMDAVVPQTHLSFVTFSGCSNDGGNGGAISWPTSIAGTRADLTNVTFSRCHASVGGAFAAPNLGRVHLTNVVFSECTATIAGGGLYAGSANVTLGGQVLFRSCEQVAPHGMSGETSVGGGALYVGVGAGVHAARSSNVTFSRCSAAGFGGCVAVDDYGTLELATSTAPNTVANFWHCLADQEGGALWVAAAALVVVNANFSDNRANGGGSTYEDVQGGGGIYYDGWSISSDDSRPRPPLQLSAAAAAAPVSAIDWPPLRIGSSILRKSPVAIAGFDVPGSWPISGGTVLADALDAGVACNDTVSPLGGNATVDCQSWLCTSPSCGQCPGLCIQVHDEGEDEDLAVRNPNGQWCLQSYHSDCSGAGQCVIDGNHRSCDCEPSPYPLSPQCGPASPTPAPPPATDPSEPVWRQVLSEVVFVGVIVSCVGLLCVGFLAMKRSASTVIIV